MMDTVKGLLAGETADSLGPWSFRLWADRSRLPELHGPLAEAAAAGGDPYHAPTGSMRPFFLSPHRIFDSEDIEAAEYVWMAGGPPTYELDSRVRPDGLIAWDCTDFAEIDPIICEGVVFFLKTPVVEQFRTTGAIGFGVLPMVYERRPDDDPDADPVPVDGEPPLWELAPTIELPPLVRERLEFTQLGKVVNGPIQGPVHVREPGWSDVVLPYRRADLDRIGRFDFARTAEYLLFDRRSHMIVVSRDVALWIAKACPSIRLRPIDIVDD